ncbi:MAG: type 4a pilus biogenesis protein PilO, partial [Gammaproteobacteria bacterium]|nr:type 4a pilus biogenesis protein PilO [Gammaproteobacteria bacterium]
MDWSQNLDFENIGNWPKPAKATVVVLTFALILSLGYFWDTSSLFKSLDTAKNREADLRQLFEQRQSLASNLDQYKSQMKEIERRFSRLLAQLPGKTEVHELLSDISRTGVSSGLEFELFKPET